MTANASTEPPGYPVPIQSELLDLADKAFANSEQEGNYAAVYNVGEYALASRVHLIRAARKSIDIQTFIWVYDESTRYLFNEIKLAAARGIRVRLLIDHLVPFGGDSDIMAEMILVNENVEIRYFNPISSSLNNGLDVYTTKALAEFNKLNRRMHNKLFIADGKVAMLGGRNYQNRYFDWGRNFNFKDRDVVVCGPIAFQVRDSFESYWDHEYAFGAEGFSDVQESIATRRSAPPEEINQYSHDPDSFEDVDKLANRYSLASSVNDGQIHRADKIEYICDPPVLESRTEIDRNPGVWAPVGAVLRGAKRRIVAQSPYLVASKRTKELVHDILEANPNLEIHFSTNSIAAADHPIVAAVSLKQQALQLNQLKYRIYQFKPYPESVEAFIPRYEKLVPAKEAEGDQQVAGPRSSIHAKSLVVDGKIAVVSSSNLDPRSAYLNTESALVIHCEPLARELESEIRRDMSPGNSWVVAKRKRYPLFGDINHLAASVSESLPVLDVWPLPRTTCFELKDGEEPVPIDHPEFYDRYRAIGNFPECEDPGTVIKTMIFKAMVGWATPLM